jgi:hypothetical protein
MQVRECFNAKSIVVQCGVCARAPSWGGHRLRRALNLSCSGEGGSHKRKLGPMFRVCGSVDTSPSAPSCPQLPHLPHISECLMKRSLKPADLRDMTIGQLQVIVNDLHSQIESKWETYLDMSVTPKT